MPKPALLDVHGLLAAPPGDARTVLTALEEARERTWILVEGVPDGALTTPAADYLSPPVWDLGHIANFEEIWLVQRLTGDGELHDGDNDRYDALRHPRQERPSLALLDRAGARRYMDEVRRRTRAVLEQAELGPDGPRLTRDGLVHWMIVLHEHQHQETLLQSMQMRGPGVVRPARPRALPVPPARSGGGAGAWIEVPAGPFRMGRPHGPRVYDNEAPEHEVMVPAFQMARFPVTCGGFLAFVEGGGYDDPGPWSAAGRAWLEESGARAPLYWDEEGGRWHRTTLLGRRPVAEVRDEILAHVTWFEAEAYARWRGARLPSEAEWEKACRLDGRGGSVGVNPWGDAPADPGRANIDQTAWGPSRAGAYPGGASPLGAEHMVGDVWEWTATEFDGYPGFEPYPYAGYSEAFFRAGYKVLRGGAWATRAGCAHGCFRNWDHPRRRQIFAGVRLTRDA